MNGTPSFEPDRIYTEEDLKQAEEHAGGDFSSERNNPNAGRAETHYAQEDVGRIRHYLEFQKDEISKNLDKLYPRSKSRTIATYEGKKYQIRYFPLQTSSTGKTVYEFGHKWEEVSGGDYDPQLEIENIRHEKTKTLERQIEEFKKEFEHALDNLSEALDYSYVFGVNPETLRVATDGFLAEMVKIEANLQELLGRNPTPTRRSSALTKLTYHLRTLAWPLDAYLNYIGQMCDYQSPEKRPLLSGVQLQKERDYLSTELSKHKTFFIGNGLYKPAPKEYNLD